MEQRLTETEVHDQLLAAIAAAGSQAAFCRAHRLSTAYINDLARKRRGLSAKVLTALGLEKVVEYRPRRP